MFSEHKVYIEINSIPLRSLTSSSDFRYTLIDVLQLFLRKANCTPISPPKVTLKPETFLNSIKAHLNIYQASMPRQFATDLPADVKQTTLKDEPKDWYIKTADFGDTHDRPLQHRSGEYTQLLEDLSVYHQILQDHCDRVIVLRPHNYSGYDVLINAAMRCLGYSAAQFQFIVVQPLQLYAFHQSDQKLHQIPDLPADELIKAVGMDALRWHSLATPLNKFAPINISTAGQATPQDPLYRVQAAHARCCQFLQGAHQQQVIKLRVSDDSPWQIDSASTATPELTDENVIAVRKQLLQKDTWLANAANEIAPHYICQYLSNLSEHCHSYLNKTAPSDSICHLLLETKNTIWELLKLLEISAPTPADLPC